MSHDPWTELDYLNAIQSELIRVADALEKLVAIQEASRPTKVVIHDPQRHYEPTVVNT